MAFDEEQGNAVFRLNFIDLDPPTFLNANPIPLRPKVVDFRAVPLDFLIGRLTMRCRCSLLSSSSSIVRSFVRSFSPLHQLANPSEDVP